MKKKSKRRKVKENTPKSDLPTTNEIPTIPKVDIKVEISSGSSERLDTSSDIRNDNQDLNTSEEPPESEESSVAKSEIVTPPSERKVTSYINVSEYFPFFYYKHRIFFFCISRN